MKIYGSVKQTLKVKIYESSPDVSPDVTTL